jgi:hypothetical protein
MKSEETEEAEAAEGEVPTVGEDEESEGGDGEAKGDEE